MNYNRNVSKGRSHNRRGDSKVDFSFLTGFFEDSEKERLRRDLLDEKAHELGKYFAKKDRISSSQLRNFFNDVRSLEARVKVEDFQKVLPHIKMLKAKVAYAQGRNLVPFSFKKLISQCVDLIEDERDFGGFVKFFEAIVGFFYGEGGGRNR